MDFQTKQNNFIFLFRIFENESTLQHVSIPRMHGRSKMAAASTSNATTCEGCRSLHVELRPFFLFHFRILADSHRFSFDTHRFSLNRADSRPFGPNRIVSTEYWCVSVGIRKSAGKEKKKKKHLKLKIPVDLIHRYRHLQRP